MSEKIFVGSAKIIATKFGSLTKVSFSAKDLETLKNNLQNGWVNCVIKEKQNKVEGKPTHYLEVDSWKPTGVQTQSVVSTGLNGDMAEQFNQSFESDLPF